MALCSFLIKRSQKLTTELGKYDALIGATTQDKSLDSKAKEQKLEQLRTEQTDSIHLSRSTSKELHRTNRIFSLTNQVHKVNPNDPKAGTGLGCCCWCY